MRSIGPFGLFRRDLRHTLWRAAAAWLLQQAQQPTRNARRHYFNGTYVAPPNL